MSNLWKGESTVVTRLRVRSAGRDPLTVQLRVTSLLDATDLHPSDLAPSAILCIRRISDPVPGTLRLEQSSARLPPEWERAVAVRIEQFARSAARPIYESVPANAEAVLFADRAELLACLAIDWLAGDLVAHWWWQSLYRNDDPARVAAAFLDAPEYIPAALHLLAQSRRALTFARALRDGDVCALRQKLTHTFGLHELHSTFEGDVEHDRREAEQPAVPVAIDEPRSDAAAQPRSITVRPKPSAPWKQWVPESSALGLDLDRQCFLGIGLMLHRAPAVERSRSFAGNVMAWGQALLLLTAASDRTTQPLPDEEDSGLLQPGVAPAAAPLTTPDGSRSLHDMSSATDRMSQPHSSDVARRSSLQYMRVARLHDDHAVVPIMSDAGVPSNDRTDASDERASTSQVDRSADDAPSFSPTEDIQATGILGNQIETEFGGIFYLVNLGLALSLYGDFTSPARPGIPLPIWDFLALTGLEIIGDKLTRDPIWPLLARLAGRQSDEPLGRHFRPPSGWRIPPEWLNPFPEGGTWSWTANSRRLRVRHPGQFLVLDVPLEGSSPLRKLRREMKAYSRGRVVRLRRARPQSVPAGKTRIQRWISWLLPYAQARLLRALGVARRRDIQRLVCRHRARVIVSSTRIDLEFSLDKLPIQIRLCGLDRNPGWVPAAGRFIAFQYK